MSDVSDTVNKLGGSDLCLDTGGLRMAEDLVRIPVVVAGWAFEADDNTQNQALFYNFTNHDLYVEAVKLVPEAAVTADNTNYSTLDVNIGSSPAGAATHTAAADTTKITGTDDWVADTPIDMTMDTDPDERTVAPGEYVWLHLDGTNGTGVDLPITMVLVDLVRARS